MITNRETNRVFFIDPSFVCEKPHCGNPYNQSLKVGTASSIVSELLHSIIGIEIELGQQTFLL